MGTSISSYWTCNHAMAKQLPKCSRMDDADHTAVICCPQHLKEQLEKRKQILLTAV